MIVEFRAVAGKEERERYTHSVLYLLDLNKTLLFLSRQFAGLDVVLAMVIAVDPIDLEVIPACGEQIVDSPCFPTATPTPTPTPAPEVCQPAELTTKGWTSKLSCCSNIETKNGENRISFPCFQFKLQPTKDSGGPGLRSH